MIDKLNLTLNIAPDIKYLKSIGKVNEDSSRNNIYKFLCRMDKATLLYLPHKFSDSTNAKIPFTKIDINPKYFECYLEMWAYIDSMFRNAELSSEDFNASRIDIAADIEDFPIDCILSILRIARIRSESLSFFKGTIYAGSDPKIRIYEKVKEIKQRLKKGQAITEYERGLLESGKSYTRFEIQIRNNKKSLAAIADDPVSFASYFDRLEMFDFKNNDGSGVLQTLYKYINRKFRSELERYRNFDVPEAIKNKYIEGVTDWFDPSKEPF